MPHTAWQAVPSLNREVFLSTADLVALDERSVALIVAIRPMDSALQRASSILSASWTRD